MHSTKLTREDCRDYIEKHLFGPLEIQGNRLQNQVGAIGLELEAFPLNISDQKNIEPASLYGSSGSLVDALVRVSEQHGARVQYLHLKNNDDPPVPIVAAIQFPNGSNFNFEPGAQVEISTAPCDSISRLQEQLTDLQQMLNHLTENRSFGFIQVGTHPLFSANAIGMQMDKPRYRIMARYFDDIGPFGRMMMLQTCSLQVNLDTGLDWETKAKRITAASLLAPFATALFANSSVTAGKINGYQSFRSHIWQHLDSSRTGIWTNRQNDSKFDKDAIIDSYLDFALDAPVICIEEFGNTVFPSSLTMKHWMTHPVNGLSPSLAHFKNHLTFLFPEVRLKGYLELRSVDAPPPEWQLVPALFYGGLLYNKQTLNKLLDLLLPEAAQIPSLMQEATYGLKSDKIHLLALQLMRLAIDGFNALPQKFTGDSVKQLIAFYDRYPLQRRTFADDLVEKYLNDKITIF